MSVSNKYINRIINTDALSLVKKLKKEGILVDAIITDPPYNISRENNFHTLKGRKGIDFGKWDKGFDNTKWILEAMDIVKPGGNIIIFNDWKNMGELSKALMYSGCDVKDLLRWVKKNPMPRNTNRRYVTDFEFAIWAVKKGGKWTFNKPVELPYKTPKFEDSIPTKKIRIHPTQKSYKVISEIIKIHTKKNDIILDLFSGSGVISKAASELSRRFIASEINEEFIDLSIKTIKGTYVRPVFNHIGNKYRMLENIFEAIPNEKIDNFVDVFAGSGVLTASYNNASKYFVNDKDENLINILKGIKESKLPELIKKIEKTIQLNSLDVDINKNNLLKRKDSYNKLKQKYNTSANKNFIDLLILIIFGYNHQIRFNSSGQFNIPIGKTRWTDNSKEKLIDFHNAISTKNITFKNEDFDIFVNKLLKRKTINPNNSIFYFDPPYYLSDATYNNIWSESNEEKLYLLLNHLNKKGYKWILSNVLKSKGETNDLLDKFIRSNKKYNKKQIRGINYKNSSYNKKESPSEDVEIIVTNYE